MKTLAANVKTNWKVIITFALLLLGVLLILYLMQNRQVFKSRASSGIKGVLNITDETGNSLTPVGNNVFKTNSRKIRIGIKDLEQLK